MQKNLRMSTILRLFFILVVIVPVILICAVILNIYERDILQQNTGRSLQTSQAVAYSVSQEINRMAGLFASIGVDQDVILTVFDVHHKEGIEKQLASNKLKILIEKYTASVSGRVLSVNFFFDNGKSYSYLKNMMSEESTIRQQQWYHDTTSTPNIVRFLGMLPNMLYGNYNPYIMAAALSPSDPNPLSKLEMILFTFESGAFDRILQSRDNSESVLHIVSEKGEIIASNTIVDRGSLIPGNWKTEIGHEEKGSFVDDTEGNRKLITYARVDNSNWYIVQMLPYKDLLENYRSVNSFVWFLAILIILAFVLVSFYLVSNVTEPISALLRQMVRVTGGDLNARYTGSGSLEMVRLGHSFNLMTEQVKELIDQHEQQEIEKRKAEFAALQSQINPHFLINTLNSIKYMALISKADNIRNMTHALTRLLASSFNRGGLLTTIEEEVDHLKHYLYIMEIRFGRPIQTEWNIDSKISRHYLLKLLLQPILENSIIHGLKEIDYPGKIEVAIHAAEDDLLITIADNGAGMPDELMLQAPDKAPSYAFSGMGNRNVHRRIQLHYGDRYGLQYEPNYPHGTKVRIRLPLIAEPDEEEMADIPLKK
ncbi:sensor histidine kinase [Paenibacillus sp. PL91]|uniref:sensor histidine kinase n=1 Tax=Paenibacillus sp. PL91 TaxID=2729538 RepID=UPI00145CD9EC|nr:sensor histidine kinase [Paenibacillus sp. PL91]MBC9200851.1 histidine kinase [Paenibacillus sp. PL91]